MNNLTAYRCLECGHYTISKLDGVRCAKCGGVVEPGGNATNVDINKGVNINVSLKDTDIFKRMIDVFSALMNDRYIQKLK